MSRAGLTGKLDGTIAGENADFNFTVSWQNAVQTTGSANVYHEGSMRNGTFTEQGASVSFSANRQ